MYEIIPIKLRGRDRDKRPKYYIMFVLVLRFFTILFFVHRRLQ